MSPRNDNKSESDVDDDDHVAASRAGKEEGEDDGSYVGRTGSDDAPDSPTSSASSEPVRPT